MQTNKTTNVILGVIALALIVIIILFLTHKNAPAVSTARQYPSNEEPVQTVPVVQTQPTKQTSSVSSSPVSVNSNSQNKVSDTTHGFSFVTINGGTATKLRTEPGWQINSESIVTFSPGSNEDPSTWPNSSFSGTQIFGQNIFKVYKLTNGDGQHAYEFVLTGTSKSIVVTSKNNPPQYIDLSSVQL